MITRKASVELRKNRGVFQAVNIKGSCTAEDKDG